MAAWSIPIFAPSTFIWTTVWKVVCPPLFVVVVKDLRLGPFALVEPDVELVAAVAAAVAAAAMNS
jgi:hypothetical protein